MKSYPAWYELPKFDVRDLEFEFPVKGDRPLFFSEKFTYTLDQSCCALDIKYIHNYLFEEPWLPPNQQADFLIQLAKLFRLTRMLGVTRMRSLMTKCGDCHPWKRGLRYSTASLDENAIEWSFRFVFCVDVFGKLLGLTICMEKPEVMYTWDHILDYYKTMF